MSKSRCCESAEKVDKLPEIFELINWFAPKPGYEWILAILGPARETETDVQQEPEQHALHVPGSTTSAPPGGLSNGGTCSRFKGCICEEGHAGPHLASDGIQFNEYGP
jgi:hypothetical protein